MSDLTRQNLVAAIKAHLADVGQGGELETWSLTMGELQIGPEQSGNRVVYHYDVPAPRSYVESGRASGEADEFAPYRDPQNQLD